MSEKEQQVELGAEVVEWRGADSKVFQKKGQPGEFQLVGFEHAVHYKDEEGKLQDIDLTVIDGRVEKGLYISELMKDKIGISLTYRDTKQRVDVILKDIPYKAPTTTEGNVVTFEDVAKDLDIIFVHEIDVVRVFRKLKTKDAPVKAVFEVIVDAKEGESAGVHQAFFGGDADGKQVILNTEFDEPKQETLSNGQLVTRQIIRDEFLLKTINIDEKTRVRSESDKVVYPVMIDPTIGSKPTFAGVGGIKDSANFHIYQSSSNAQGEYASASGNQDNTDVTLGAGSRPDANFVQQTGYTGEFDVKYLRFPHITLPVGAIINSAILKIWGYNQPGVGPGYTATPSKYPILQARGYNGQGGTLSTQPGSMGQSTIVNSVIYRTDWVKNLANTLTLKATNFMPFSSTTALSASDQIDFDVTQIVQRLNDQFVYDDEAMFFDIRAGFNIPQNAPNTTSFRPAKMYGTGNQPSPSSPSTTTYGNGPKVTSLIIDFTAPAPDTTILADAMLLYQGAVWGNCGDQPW